MKIHKLGLMAALAAALAFSPALNAQEKKEGKRQGPPTAAQREDMLKQRMTRMSEELKLTDAQKPKVEAALKAQAEKMQGLREATPEVRREKGQAIRADMEKKMKEILTADQYASWEKLRAQGREGRGGPGGEKKRGEKKADKN
jgi:periplasmic protein CpxP/Spy